MNLYPTQTLSQSQNEAIKSAETYNNCQFNSSADSGPGYGFKSDANWVKHLIKFR